jgi:hypothetical protein
MIDWNIIITLLQETKYGTQIYLFREKNIEYTYTSSFKWLNSRYKRNVYW